MCSGNYTELSLTTPVGRKDYWCEWCNELIPKGTKHVSRVYIFEDDFNSGRMHDECFEASGKADHEDICDGWNQGDFKRGQSVPKGYDD